MDARGLACGVGIDAALLNDPIGTLTAQEYGSLWDAAVKLTRDEALGLHVGEVLRLGKYGILGYAMISSSTLLEALERQRRYQDLVGKAGRSELICNADEAVLQWHSPLTAYSRHIGEEHLASWLAFARMMLGSDKQALRVDFAHAAPAALQEHQRLFNCPLRFDQPCNAIHFPRAYLDAPLREKNPVMLQLMDQHAEQLLRQHQPENTYGLDRVRRVIADLLIEGTPTIEQIAAQVERSSRSLQRELAAAGWTYKDLLDDVRQQLAVQYMRAGHLSNLEIAFALGFSEQSSFQRAFKRWTGLPPGQYRLRIPGVD